MKLFWLDLEMTGLDIEKEVIIECAVLITDLQLRILDSYDTVVFQPQVHLDGMDEWNKKHHGESGLTAKVPHGLPLEEVETHLIGLIRKHFQDSDDRPILAGNSISQDRLFVDKYMSGFSTLLNYRMLDVTSWKVIFNNLYNKKYEKKNLHRALEDLHESLNELKFYLSFIGPTSSP